MATSKAFITAESTVKLNGEAGADHAWSMETIADGAGRVSIQVDWGAAPRANIYDWSAEALMQATPTQGTTIDFYIATAPEDDATQVDGDLGVADAALGDIDQLRNLQYIGALVIEEADTTKMVGAGSFSTNVRFFSIVGMNNTGATINATDSNFVFKLSGRALQGQAT